MDKNFLQYHRGGIEMKLLNYIKCRLKGHLLASNVGAVLNKEYKNKGYPERLYFCQRCEKWFFIKNNIVTEFKGCYPFRSLSI